VTRASSMAVPEIAQQMGVGRLTVYALLEAGTIPGIRFGRRWIISRNAFEEWWRTCGMHRCAQ